MTYRDDLAALAARRAALEHEVIHKTRELAETARLLDEATARARLPVLDNIKLASPCTARWSEMTGDERTRHCTACDKTVYNLSGMTRDEAEALITERQGQLCARYYQRADGTILLADCSVGTARRRASRRVVAAGAVAMLASAGMLGLQALPAPLEQQTLDGDLGIRGSADHERPAWSARVNLAPRDDAPPEDMAEMLGGISVED